MKVVITIIVILVFILLLATQVMGQPTLPSGPSQAPIDGGLGLVAAAGAAYAWKKHKNKSK